MSDFYEAESWRNGNWQNEANKQGTSLEEAISKVLNAYCEENEYPVEVETQPSITKSLFAEHRMENSKEKLGYDVTLKEDVPKRHYIDENNQRYKYGKAGWRKKNSFGLQLDVEIKNVDNGNLYLVEAKNQQDKGNAWERAFSEFAHMPRIIDEYEEIKGLGFIFAGGIVDGQNAGDYIYKIDAGINEGIEYLDVPDEVQSHTPAFFWHKMNPNLLIQHFEEEIKPLII